MGVCTHNIDAQDPDEVTVTCFGKKKGKRSGIACNSILVETEGFIRDLRQEVTQLRHAQSGKPDDARHLEATVERLLGEKEMLMEERGGLKEELMGLKVEKTNLEQRVEKLTAENEDLVTEFQDRSRELNMSMASAAEEQHETSRTTETLKHLCDANKRLLLEANQKLLHRTSDLKELQTLYDASKAEVERLSAELSNMDAWKVVTAAELDVKVTDMNKKYSALKRVCRGKDMMINQLREEKSKALMQLWQTAYGHKAQYFSCTPTHADRQIPMATVGPYQNEVITFCNATSPVKCQDIGNQLNETDFIKNKTMSMELELYRTRKMAEIFGDKFNPLQPDRASVETRSTCSGSGGDVSASISEFSDVVLDDIPEETLNNIGDQLNETDFIKNKTMSMELELYRTRKMAEIFGDKINPLQPDWASVETRSTCSGSGGDVSASISEFSDVVLVDTPEETLNLTYPQSFF
ncbi:uncharacterized protein LOC124142496 isoform X1 [Haliotis rufescens]|uniref:uncharacterized protein LOC124142496 isoform X1 n=1 Tax=Haliotis rufescens TaxID=6454 RepID=UPI00201FAD06|nr:uncharacterized protein LOC124142496 isoform X1 [Haliotis rufescens]